MPSRQPGRRAIIVASIIGLSITLIWAATFRRLYLNTHPLATWEQSTCRDTAPAAANTSPAAGNVLVGVQALVSPAFRGAGIPTRAVICAFRVSDGALVRRYLLPGRISTDQYVRNPTFNTLRQVGDTLYISTNDGRICALRATDGQTLWCHTLQPYTPGSELIVADGVVYSKTNTLFEALDARDGTLLWHDNLADSLYSPTHQAQTFIASNGMVFVGKNTPLPDNPAQSTFTLCARAARTGTLGWCQTFGTGAHSLAGVERGGDTIFAFVKDTSPASPTPPVLYALSAADGNVLWKRQLDCPDIFPPLMAYAPDASAPGHGALLLSELSCDDNASKFSNVPHTLLALRSDDGAPLWKVTPGPLADLVVADGVVYLDTPEIANGIYIARATTIQALRIADASPLWRFRIPTLSPRLTLTGDTLLALTGPFSVAASSPEQSVYALRRADGSELWQSAGCDATIDPYFWHDHILRHEQGAPVWCHWPAIGNYTETVNPVLQ